MRKKPVSKKALDKVSAELVKDPFATARELAERTWLWKSTTNRAALQLGHVGIKDDRIVNLTETDLHIVRLSQLGILEKLTDDKERKKIHARDLSIIAEKSEKRYSLFRWDVTDEQWGTKSFTEDSLYDEED